MGLIDELTLENLDKDQRELAELIGLDNFKKILLNYRGTPLYIPKLDGIGKSFRNVKIREKFNGYNFKELAKEFELTDVTIRSIVADLVKYQRTKPAKDQITLFE